MFLVHWGYALANIIVCFLVWSYIGHANPAVKPGVSAEFNFFEWLKNSLLRLMGYIFSLFYRKRDVKSISKFIIIFPGKKCMITSKLS